MLNRLVDGPADVWTLRELTLHVDAVLSKTLSLLPRLTGLTRLTLHLDNLITVVSWPPLIGLKALTLLGDGTECPIWGSLLLAALAVSPTRHSLEKVCLCGGKWSGSLRSTVAAVAPHLKALRQLTAGEYEWTFVRGVIVGSSPRY